jgi:hypothetical protein
MEYHLELPGSLKPALTPEARLKQQAEKLSAQGWRFQKQSGPRGTYYNGYGPRGKRIMSAQHADEREAFRAAIEHASS